MAADLPFLPKALPTPPGFVIEQVKETVAAENWCGVLCLGFEMPAFVGKAFFDLLGSLGLDPESPFRHYIGRLNGEAVAASSLFMAAGVAGIYNVVTLPDARRKGIGAALTLYPLLEARALGYRVGILHSSVMGVNAYRRLGFQEHCRIGQHVWPGDETSAGAGVLPFLPERVGSWWDRTREIDVVAVSEQQCRALVGECKWWTKPVGTDVLDDLRGKTEVMLQATRAYEVISALFSRSGFTPALVERAEREGVILVDVADLFGR